MNEAKCLTCGISFKFKPSLKRIFCSRSCVRHTEEHKRKIGDFHRGKKLPPLSDKTKQKIRQTLTGRKLSEEQIKNLSIRVKNEWDTGIRKPRFSSKERKEHVKKYFIENKDKIYERNKKWAEKNRENLLKYYRNISRLKKYGINLKEYEKMLIIQKCKCLICDKECITGQALSVDHNHLTGKIRGLLCKKCNSGIGLLGDSTFLLKRAINYLKKYD